MNQADIFSPMFAMFGLTIVVWVYMYSRRLPFILGQKIPSSTLTIPGELARLSPPGVANPSDNLKNLFEMPVLFYAVTTYLFVTASVDETYLKLAWLFVGLRVAHSIVHCTVNIVTLRFSIYAASCVALFFILGRAAALQFGLWIAP